ncbi:MFS transporter [Hafnia alvei]|uniref:MFS transporter n=1 Tax=Hafnia alvei TaxID=569 RepID=UPI00103C520D|nr:MFS transporter [Hafnia alvei]QBJ34287.1 MFS transporter [Hafnia alvei]
MKKHLTTVGATFFLWGLITAFNSTLILFFYRYFQLSWPQAMLVNVIFYIAPFLTCLPCSKLIALYGYRTMLRSALLLTMSGCGLLSLALGCYSIIGALFAVFAIATGVAAMQVVANPYLTLLSQEHKRVGNLTLASAINSLGTTLAPLLIALALRASPVDYVNHNEPIKWIWFVLALFSVGLFAITFSIKLPDIIQEKKNKTHSSTLWGNTKFIYSAVAIFIYVGVEVSLGTNTINYLSTIGKWNTETAISLISLYWGGALIGRFIFGVFADRISLKIAFLSVTLVSASFILLSILLNNAAGGYLLLLIGFANSIMYPIIFSQSMTTVPHRANFAAGVLIMAGIGGAIIPYIQALMIDSLTLRFSFLLPLALYILLACWGAKHLKTASSPISVLE